MNKKIILPISLIFLVGLAVFVSATKNTMIGINVPEPGHELNFNDFETTIELNKGWNLVMGFFPDYISSSSEIKKSNIKAVFMYSPDINGYISLHPKLELTREFLVSKGIDRQDEYYDDSANLYAYWAYSDKAGKMTFTINHLSYYNMKNVFLKNGWNFVGINPEMIEDDIFTWESIRGNCNIQKIYAWDYENQDWFKYQTSTELKGYDFDDFLGSGMIVKVTNNCKLGTPSGGEITPPPGLPGGGDSSGIPETIGTYSKVGSVIDYGEVCNNEETLCYEESRIHYKDSSANKAIYVLLMDITKGTENQMKESLASAMGGVLETIFIGNDKLYRVENHELLWFIDADQPDFIFTQEATIVGDSYDYSNTATGDNAVTSYWLSKYPSIEVD